MNITSGPFQTQGAMSPTCGTTSSRNAYPRLDTWAQRTWWNVLLGMVLLLDGRWATAFQAPLTNVQTSLATNGYSVIVQYQVYDPQAAAWMAGGKSYPGVPSNYRVISRLTATGGMVVWQVAGAGTFAPLDREIGCAVYDPGLRNWRDRTWVYHGSSLNFWNLTNLTVAEGVVAWRAEGAGTVPLWDTEVGCATYNPALGMWVGFQQPHAGVPGNYWVATNLTVASGLVAWRAVNTGQFALGHNDVRAAIYDPARRAWMWHSDWYEGHQNNPWTIANLTIASHRVQWTATNKFETRQVLRGYDQASGTWPSGPTTPAAFFVASTTAGAVPFNVWFTDMSLGAASWHWDFGDGITNTQPSLLHRFTTPDQFAVTQTVSGPGGTAAATLTIAADAPPGALRFDQLSVAADDGRVRVRLISVPAQSAIVLHGSTNLTAWQALATNPPQPGPIEFDVTVPAGERGWFFRAATQ